MQAPRVEYADVGIFTYFLINNILFHPKDRHPGVRAELMFLKVYEKITSKILQTLVSAW